MSQVYRAPTPNCRTSLHQRGVAHRLRIEPREGGPAKGQLEPGGSSLSGLVVFPLRACSESVETPHYPKSHAMVNQLWAIAAHRLVPERGSFPKSPVRLRANWAIGAHCHSANRGFLPSWQSSARQLALLGLLEGLLQDPWDVVTGKPQLPLCPA